MEAYSKPKACTEMPTGTIQRQTKEWTKQTRKINRTDKQTDVYNIYWNGKTHIIYTARNRTMQIFSFRFVPNYCSYILNQIQHNCNMTVQCNAMKICIQYAQHVKLAPFKSSSYEQKKYPFGYRKLYKSDI